MSSDDLNQIISNHNKIINPEPVNLKPSPSSYVMAAMPSYRSHVQVALNDHPDYITSGNIAEFQNQNVNKFLSSVGLGMVKGKPLDYSVIERYKKAAFNKFMKAPFMRNAEITIDSGGFQLQTGYGTKEDIIPFIDVYHEFLKNDGDKIDYAFTLDLAPGQSDCLFDDFAEMEKFNNISYQKSAELPEEIRKKMLYIHHFRTPQLTKIWKRMLFENDLAKDFSNFATGGLVSNANAGQQFPVTLYVVPLIHILIHAKQRELKKFRFHVLGASECKDVITHKFIEKHIKEVHDIEVEITYDSSTVFKVLAMSRFIYAPNLEQNQLFKLSIKEEDLHRQFKNWNLTNEELYYKYANLACGPCGMKEINKKDNPIYVYSEEIKGNRLSRMNYVYGILHMLKTFKDIDQYGKQMAEQHYPLYSSGNINDFDLEIEKLMIGLNDGKNSKRLGSRTTSMANSLDALTHLDMDYADHLVERFMGADECPALTGMVNHTF